MGLFLNNDLSNFMQSQTTRLNENIIWLRIVDTTTSKEFIINLNTEKQLFDKGIDSEGTPLKDIGGNDATDSGYAPSTIERKKKKSGKGGKFANITLYDKGDYYKSHKVEVSTSGFKMTSNPQKSDTNLFTEWGEDILGLTEESLQLLINYLLIKYTTYTREIVFKR